MSIKLKLLIVFLFVSLAPIVFSSILFYSFEKKALTHQVVNQLQSVASLQHTRLESIVDQNLERLHFMANTTQLRISLGEYLLNGDTLHHDKMIRILNDAKSSISSFQEISILSPGGALVFSTVNEPWNENFRFDNRLFERGQTENCADTFYLDKDRNLRLFLAGPLILNGNLLGVIIIESDTDNIISSISDYTGLGETGDIIVAEQNADGDALFVTPTRFDDKASLKRVIKKQHVSCPISQAFAKKHDIVSDGIDYRGQEVITVAHYIDNAQWALVAKIDKGEAFMPVVKLRNFLAMIIVGCIFIIFIVSIYFAGNITRPIIALTGLARNISQGNYSQHITQISADEIGVLSQSFNEMTDNLVSANTEIEKNVKELRREILERHKVMEALKKSEDLLQSIFLSAPIGVGLLIDKKIQWINKKLVVMTGYSDSNIVGREVGMFYQSNVEFERVDHETYVQIAMRPDHTGTVETQWVRNDGVVADILLRSTPINHHDLSQGVVFTALDITEHKQAQKSIEKAKEEWEQTFNSINEIITIQDKDMRIVRANKAAYDNFEIESDKLLGSKCFEIFRGDSRHCKGCPVVDSIDDSNNHSEVMYHGKLDKFFHVSSSPIFDEKDELQYLVHVAKDITEQKKIEEQLFVNEKLATIAGLAAGVAHEINTPLSGILQSIQMIERGLSPSISNNHELAMEYGVNLTKVQSYFKKKQLDFFMEGIRDSATTAAKIIKNLLDFSRPHKGEITNTNLPGLLDRVIDLSHADYNLKKKYDIINVKIVKEYAPDITIVPCVAMEIEQVVLNLVKNAIHAMADSEKQEEPCLVIRTSNRNNMVRIEVEDNGSGVDEEVKKHIFDPFYTTKDIGEGTGLGLSVSYAIIHDKHQGNIWVESDSSKGSKFILELPLSQKAEVA
jgi:PAS domain S-box-containing protein